MNETWPECEHRCRQKNERIAELEAALEPFAQADRAIGDEPGPFRFETATGHRLIERDDLRRARAALDAEDLDEMARHANALSEHYRAEIERLRAALTRIMELGYHSLDPDVDKRMTELAREALK